MKHLGIDYGEKRMGLAVSDSGGRIAFPRRILYVSEKLFGELKSFMEKEEISKIVVGLPLASDGSETEISKKVKEFVEKLKRITALPIEFENEMLTTHMVERAGIKKEHTDEAAAALILQSYLDRINRNL